MSKTSASEKTDVRFVIICGMILLAAIIRCIPYMPNFAPLNAIAIFAAAHFARKWQAFLIPLAATFLSDLVLNNIVYKVYHPHFTWFSSGFYWMYGSYVLIVLAGLLILREVTVTRVIAAALSATTIFYLVTNFACWPGNPLYAQDLSGLATCMAAGIPFVKGTLLSDLFYSVILFGSFALLQRQIPQLRPVPASR